eukprot:gb/GFBE01053142.1/.p1 GENE.gb/GFBE01053142.1/~~gb/GFBE01053142.1/.p1  ORF type:complete len:1342 (+),score=311.07 gb/GFBE01053142.1/:1-4026(+)
MGVLGGSWDDDEVSAKAAPTATYSLEPFVFDPGPVPTKEELVTQAEKRIRQDRLLKEALTREKAAITHILQTCLDDVNGQLERGEAICQKAHFPLLNPINFNDLEAFAQHDHFAVDLRVDKVDEALRNLVSSLMQTVWQNVEVENVTKARCLERYNKALHERMDTLEHHLRDRGKQLSNCRYAYFLEITHLRNQVYIKSQEGDNFEAVEAYFFDPTEFLEEELRLQLNDKIRLSVKVYHERVVALKRRVSDLELRLETAEALNNSRGLDNLQSYLQAACGQHSAKRVVASLAELAEKEMQKWAAGWATSAGWLPGEGTPGTGGAEVPSAKNMEAMRQAMIKAGQEADQERNARTQAEEALERVRKELQDMTMRAESAEDRLDKAGLGGDPSKRPVGGVSTANVMDGASQMDELRKQVELMKLNLEKEKAKTRAAEARASEAEERAAEVASKSMSRLVSADGGALTEEEMERLEDYEKARQALAVAEEKFIGGRAAGSEHSLTSCVDRLTLALQDRQERLTALEGASSKLQKSLEEAKAEAAAAKRQAEADARKAMHPDQVQELRDARRARQQEYAAMDDDDDDAQEPPEDNALEDHAAGARRAQTFGERFAAPGGGFHCEVQTNVTAHGNGFYLLEPPDTDLEDTIKDELEDLHACAESQWESTLRTIRKAQRPPAGSGSGFCSRGAFLRLFHGVKGRLARYEELINMVNSLRRAELQQVLEGVHFLMESALPDEDLGIRDAIFGRGITQVMLDGNTEPLDFAALVKRWNRQIARIIANIIKSRASILLGVHPERRIFVPVIGAKPGNDGGTGGGLPARQRKDFSPPRHRLYDNAEAVPGTRRPPEDEEPPRRLMAIAGRSIAPFGNPGGIVTGQQELASPQQAVALRRVMDSGGGWPDADGSSSPSNHIVAGGRLVPRGLNPTPPWQQPKTDEDAEDAGHGSHGARQPVENSGLPRVQGVPPPVTASRGSSPETRRRRSPSSPSPSGREGRQGRPTSPEPQEIELAAEAADAAHAAEEQNADALKQYEAQQRSTLFATQPTTAGEATGQLPDDSTASFQEAAVGQSSEDFEASLYVPMLYLPFGSAAAQEVEARMAHSAVGAGAGLAAVRNVRGGEGVASGARRPGTATTPLRPADDVNSRRPGTAPAGARPAANNLSNWRPLAHGPAAADPERSLERERHRWVEGAALGKSSGPMPTWEFEDAMERKSRPMGGRHTSGTSASRPESACRGASAGAGAANRGLSRMASAGRIRPAGRANAPGMSRSNSSGAVGASASKRSDGTGAAPQLAISTGLPPPRRWLPKPGAPAAVPFTEGQDSADGSAGSFNVRALSGKEVLRQ